MDKQQIKSVIESLLFVSGESVKFARLAKICETQKREVEIAIEELNKDYKKRESGIFVLIRGESAQMATNPEYSKFTSQLVNAELHNDLSRSALEVLSIVAYRGPVTRAHVESIRGVNCSYVLKNLILKGLIERKETADIRGYVYEVSFDFLRSIGIQKVNELPDWEKLSADEKIEELIKNSDQKQDSFQ